MKHLLLLSLFICALWAANTALANESVVIDTDGAVEIATPNETVIINPIVTTPALPTADALPAPSTENALIIAETHSDEVRTVPLPRVEGGNVAAALELGLDVSEPVMLFNDVLLLLNRVDGLAVIVAPELSDPETIAKKISIVPGRIALREFLNLLSTQIGGTWQIDENQTIVINKINTTTIVEASEPAKSKIDVEFAAVPLANAASHIARQTGLQIRVAESIRDLPIEIMVQGWEADRILRYIADQYELQLARGEDLVYVFSKE